jgi:hypothetical protein
VGDVQRALRISAAELPPVVKISDLITLNGMNQKREIAHDAIIVINQVSAAKRYSGPSQCAQFSICITSHR